MPVALKTVILLTRRDDMGRHASADDDDGEFSILFVCTGNIHRSPMAERLTIARLRPLTSVQVHSAGVRAVVGATMGAHSAEAIRQLGADPDDHVARQINSEMIRAADLVLTAETAHRDLVMADVPTALRRTFTLLEFVRLARHATPAVSDQEAHRGGLVQRVLAIGSLRGQVAPPQALEDVADPVGASLRETQGCAAEIATAVNLTIAALGIAT